MKLLPKDQFKIELSRDGVHIIASFYEHKGYRWYDKYHLSDFSNDLIGLNDLKRCGINMINIQGFTPKEHCEMMDRELMFKWQAEREEADRKWRAKQDWRLVFIAGIFTILGAIVAAFISLVF